MLPGSCPCRHGPLLGGGSDRAVFLDRDGVLIEDTGYPDDPDRLALLPGVGEALRRFAADHRRLVVVTNQSGVARGFFSLERLDACHDRLRELLAAEGVRLDGIYYCPHHPAAAVPEFALLCDHRKPGPGMLLSAARELGLDLTRCWIIGDREGDIQAGLAAGVPGIRIRTADACEETAARAVASNLFAAACWLLR
ncbi:MAG: HAD family hydrolase [Armatimonadetes bacterium]|nr:HAD family hydrolase [Armatimonadota bacterium]